MFHEIPDLLTELRAAERRRQAAGRSTRAFHEAADEEKILSQRIRRAVDRDEWAARRTASREGRRSGG